MLVRYKFQRLIRPLFSNSRTMSRATILITGPRLPYHVVDYAIGWARDNEGSLNALFVIPGKMPEEGYPFPNDLDEAEQETTGTDVEKGLVGLVQDEIRFIEKRCKASHIPVTTEMMFSPSIKKLAAKLDEAEVTFIDKRIEEDKDDMSELSFTVDELMENSAASFISIGELDKYSDVVL